ncbi:MAG TPA: maleylpyruvate isomerase N-terminal domain-containing protein, partial [Trebonia sp.]
MNRSHRLRGLKGRGLGFRRRHPWLVRAPGNTGVTSARCPRVGSVTPDGYLLQLRPATADLAGAIGCLSDADVRAPSPLPGWTRGHVL